MPKAAGVKDILAIEKELTRIQSTIDSLEGRFKNLKNRVGLASVTLIVERERVLGPLGLLAAGIGWVIKKLFIIH